MVARAIVASVASVLMLGAASTSASSEPERLRWKKEVECGIASGGAVVRLVDEKYLFVVGDLCGNAHAFDVQKGEIVWSTSIGSEGVQNAPAPLAGGVVFVLPTGRAVALDAGNGEIRWTRDLDDEVVAAPSMSLGGQVLVGTRSGALLALDENGEPAGEVQTGGPIWHPVVAGRDGGRYATVQDIDGGLRIYRGALDETASGDSIDFAELPTAAPAVDRRGRVFYAVRGHLVVREPSGSERKFKAPKGKPVGVSVSPDGNTAWLAGESRERGYWLRAYGLETEESESPVTSPDFDCLADTAGLPTSAPAVDHLDSAYLALSTGYVISASARKDGGWCFNTTATVRAAPVVASGAVFIGDLGGRVYAIETKTKGEWDYDWPTVGQNAQRTGQAVGEYFLAGEIIEKVEQPNLENIRIKAKEDVDGEVDDMFQKGNANFAVAAGDGVYSVATCRQIRTDGSQPSGGGRTSTPDLCKQEEKLHRHKDYVLVERIPVQRLRVGDPVPVPKNANVDVTSGYSGPEIFEIAEDGPKREIEKPTDSKPLVWRSKDRTMHAAAPGLWLVKWQSKHQTMIAVRIRVEWPEKDRMQTYLAGAPGVKVTDDKEFPHAFLWNEEDGWKPMKDGLFMADRPGRSLVALSDNMDLNAGERLAFIAVESFDPSDQKVFLGEKTALIGSEIPWSTDFPDVHDPGSGAPHVWHDLARVNVGSDYYDRETRKGPIFPVNTDDNLLLAFYRKTSALIRAGFGDEVSAFPGWVDEQRFYGENRYASSSVVNRDKDEATWPVSAARYRSVWPKEGDGKGLVIAKTLHESYDLPDSHEAIEVYRQKNPDEAGYNPNEEHAWVQDRKLWVLRSDLNTPETSEPYVLLTYKDRDKRPAMSVVRVVADDGRGFEGYVEVGQARPMLPPKPLAVLQLNEKSSVLQTTDDATAVFEDRTGRLWAYRAGHSGSDLVVVNRYCYHPRDDFDTPDRTLAGDCAGSDNMLAWLSEHAESERRSRGEGRTAENSRRPLGMRYVVRWPKAPPILRPGRMLTVPRGGLSGIHGHDSVEILYQQSTALGQRDSVRLLDVVSAREVDVEDGLPDSFAFPRTDEIGGLTFFSELPPHLRHQLYYHEGKRTLAFRGRYMKGDGKDGEEMYETPLEGEYVLMNVLSQADAEIIRKTLKDNGKFGEALEELIRKVTDPVVLTNPAVNEDNFALGTIHPPSAGFVTYVVDNDNSERGVPQVRALRVSEDFDPGKVLVIKHSNPFAEQVYIRHSGDFGGFSDKYEFKWEYADAEDGDRPSEADWVRFQDKVRVAEMLEGTEQLADRWVRTSFRKMDGGEWSPPTEPQLVEGWLKRVVEGVNSFDNSLPDFRRTPPSTTVTILEKAGVRYRGAVPLTVEAADKLGMIEVYETVYRRGKALGIGLMNRELQTFAGRLADLYLLLGDEAYADAVDPSLLVRTPKGSASKIRTMRHAFVNQTASLLDEELALLRGVGGDTAAVRNAPVHNRLLWNFTDSDAQALYVENYGITESDTDIAGAGQGRNISLGERAAEKRYPQGHGDAYGHYLTALKVYYWLLRETDFMWTPGPVPKEIGGLAVLVDYFDERKLAQAAAGRARTGLDTIDLTYKRDYGEVYPGFLRLTRGIEATNPATGREAQPALLWGVGDWTSRVGQGAYLDWVTVNALVPKKAIEGDDLLGKLDRESVSELGELIQLGEEIQIRLDDILSGRNPLRIPDTAVPFNIDVQRQIKEDKSAFPILMGRAERQLKQAESALQEVVSARKGLAEIRDEGQRRQRLFEEGERALNAQMISMFGTPFASDIGSNSVYEEGYDGPDLDNYMCMDSAVLAHESSGSELVVAKLPSHTGPEGEIVSQVEINLPCLKEEGDAREQTGEIQYSLRNVIMAKLQFDKVVEQYMVLIENISDISAEVEMTENIHKRNIEIWESEKKKVSSLNAEILIATQTAAALELHSQELMAAARAAAEAIPKGLGVTAGWSFGTWTDPFAPAKGAVLAAGQSGSYVLKLGALAGRALAMGRQNVKELLPIENSLKRIKNSHEISKFKLRNALEHAIRSKTELELTIGVRFEALQGAFDNHRSTIAKAKRLLTERHRHRTLTEVDIEKLRYGDMALRLLRQEDVNRYRQEFDSAQLAVYLLARQYDFETNYAQRDPCFLAPDFYRRLTRVRTLGGGKGGGGAQGCNQMLDAGTSPGGVGLWGVLRDLESAYEEFVDKRGPKSDYVETADLRYGLFRIPYYMHPATPGKWRSERWREILRAHIFHSLSAFPDLQGCCAGLREEDGSFLIVPFSTPLLAAVDWASHNHFGIVKEPGESGFRELYTGSVLKGIKVVFQGYPESILVGDPWVYLVPAGLDMFRSPALSGRPAQMRVWSVEPKDSVGNVDSPWSASRSRYPGFPADYDGRRSVDLGSHDALARQHYGRSVYNTRWYLIVPIQRLAPTLEVDQIIKRFLGSPGETSGIANIYIQFHVRANESN